MSSRKTSLQWFDVACNDHRNGAFLGRADALNLLDCEFTLAVVDRAPVFTHLKEGAIRIHRRVIPYQQYKYGRGNWCWDGFLITRHQAFELVRLLKATGKWDMEAGPSDIFNWFNRETAQ